VCHVFKNVHLIYSTLLAFEDLQSMVLLRNF
jgi:hypothetical protein